MTNKRYVPRLHLYVRNETDEDQKKIFGMVRGLMVANCGHNAIEGCTNDRWLSQNDKNGKIILRFPSVEKAHYFFEDAKKWCAIEIRKVRQSSRLLRIRRTRRQ